MARGGFLERSHNPFVRAALLQRCPAISEYLPADTATLFDKYVPLIDIETTLELTKLFNLLPGILGVAFRWHDSQQEMQDSLHRFKWSYVYVLDMARPGLVLFTVFFTFLSCL